MSFVIPETGDPTSESIVGRLDYLLAGLLRDTPSTLSARYHDPDKNVIWYLTTDSAPVEFYQTRADYFRTFLARFGSQFMNAKVYGGEANQQLIFLGNRYSVDFKMANSQQAGYWIEIAAK